MSPFEADPAVRTLRAWSAATARAINEGATADAASTALMTSGLIAQLPKIVGGEIGSYYPGPLPFTPLSVTWLNAGSIEVRACFLRSGYARPGGPSHAPKAYRALPILARIDKVADRWQLAQFAAASFSCAGVAVTERAW